MTLNSGFLQGGISFRAVETANSRVVASLLGQYSNSSSTVRDGAGTIQGTISSNTGGIGASATWLMANGFYADAVGLVNLHSIKTRTATSATGSTRGNTLSGSFEAGFQFPIAEGTSLVPQAQIVMQRTSINSFTDSAGTTVAFGNSKNVEGRLGVALEHVSSMFTQNGVFKINGSVNVVHDFTNGSGATVNGTSLGFDAKGTELLLAGGVELQPNVDGLRFGTRASYHTPLNNSGRRAYSLTGTIGWKF